MDHCWMMLILFWKFIVLRDSTFQSISDDNTGWHDPWKTTSEFIDYHTISWYFCYRKPYAFTKWYYRLQELSRMEFRRIRCPLSLTRHPSSPTRSHSFRQWYSAQNWLIRFDPLITFPHTIQTIFHSISHWNSIAYVHRFWHRFENGLSIENIG